MGGSGDASTAATPKLAPSGSDLSMNELDRVDGSGPTDQALAVAHGISRIKMAVSKFQHLINDAENICKTRLLIGKLAKNTLAKLNQASEIFHRQTDPALAVADGISQIKMGVSILQHIVNIIGTLNDMGCIPGNTCKSRLYIGKIVKYTLARLNRASEIYPSIEVLLAGQRNADYKLAKYFQTVLQEFKEAQRLVDEREGPFAPNRFFSVDWPGQSDEEAYQTMIARHEEVRRFTIDFDERRQQGLQEVQQQILGGNHFLKDVCDYVHELVGTVNIIGHEHRRSNSRSNSFPSYLPLVMFDIVLVAVGIVFAAGRWMF